MIKTKCGNRIIERLKLTNRRLYMDIEDGYKKILSYDELTSIKYLSYKSNDENNELSTLYEIRFKYIGKRQQAFYDEYGIKDCELGLVFDELYKEELNSLNKLRISVGKEEIDWNFD